VADRAPANAFSVTGLSRVRRDPWLCGPASRPGCLCRRKWWTTPMTERVMRRSSWLLERVCLTSGVCPEVAAVSPRSRERTGQEATGAPRPHPRRRWFIKPPYYSRLTNWLVF